MSSTCSKANAELALALRRSDREMAFELTGDRLLTRLPVMFGLLRAGECSPRHVEALIAVTGELDIDQVLAVDEAVSARAATMPVAAFRRVARKAVARIDK